MPKHDQLALSTMRRVAVRAAEVDPAAASRLCYRFSVRLTRVPPTLALDLLRGVWPLKELVDARIELDGVE